MTIETEQKNESTESFTKKSKAWIKSWADPATYQIYLVFAKAAFIYIQTILYYLLFVAFMLIAFTDLLLYLSPSLASQSILQVFPYLSNVITQIAASQGVQLGTAGLTLLGHQLTFSIASLVLTAILFYAAFTALYLASKPWLVHSFNNIKEDLTIGTLPLLIAESNITKKKLNQIGASNYHFIQYKLSRNEPTPLTLDKINESFMSNLLEAREGVNFGPFESIRPENVNGRLTNEEMQHWSFALRKALRKILRHQLKKIMEVFNRPLKKFYEDECNDKLNREKSLHTEVYQRYQSPPKVPRTIYITLYYTKEAFLLLLINPFRFLELFATTIHTLLMIPLIYLENKYKSQTSVQSNEKSSRENSYQSSPIKSKEEEISDNTVKQTKHEMSSTLFIIKSAIFLLTAVNYFFTSFLRPIELLWDFTGGLVLGILFRGLDLAVEFLWITLAYRFGHRREYKVEMNQMNEENNQELQTRDKSLNKSNQDSYRKPVNLTESINDLFYQDDTDEEKQKCHIQGYSQERAATLTPNDRDQYINNHH